MRSHSDSTQRTNMQRTALRAAAHAERSRHTWAPESSSDDTRRADLDPLICFYDAFEPGDTLRAQWIGLDPVAPPGERRVTGDALDFELAL